MMFRREFLKAFGVLAVPFRMAWGAIAPPKKYACELPTSVSGQVLRQRLNGWDCEARWRYLGDGAYQIIWLRMRRPAGVADYPAPKLLFKDGQAQWVSWCAVLDDDCVVWEWTAPLGAGEQDIIHDESPFGFRFSILSEPAGE